MTFITRESASSYKGDLLNLVLTRKAGKGIPAYARLGGLAEEGLYRLEGEYDAWQVYLQREK